MFGLVPHMQRDKETKRQRDKETKRDKETEEARTLNVNFLCVEWGVICNLIQKRKAITKANQTRWLFQSDLKVMIRIGYAL